MCNRCKGTGLLPFEKNGKVIPYAYLNCTCKPEPVEHHEDLKPEDFDFVMSSDFRSASFEYCGQVDTGDTPSQPDFTAIEDRLSDMEMEISSPGGIPRRYTEELQQVKGMVAFLENKLNEHTDPKEKQVPKKVKQEYGDISV